MAARRLIPLMEIHMLLFAVFVTFQEPQPKTSGPRDQGTRGPGTGDQRTIATPNQARPECILAFGPTKRPEGRGPRDHGIGGPGSTGTKTHGTRGPALTPEPRPSQPGKNTGPVLLLFHKTANLHLKQDRPGRDAEKVALEMGRGHKWK